MHATLIRDKMCILVANNREATYCLRMATTRTPGRKVRGVIVQDHQRLGRLRYEAGLSKCALAQRAGISTGTLCDIENGIRNAAPKTLAKIAGALGVTTRELMRQDQP